MDGGPARPSRVRYRDQRRAEFPADVRSLSNAGAGGGRNRQPEHRDGRPGRRDPGRGSAPLFDYARFTVVGGGAGMKLHQSSL